MLYEHKVLTTHQIVDLAFPSRRAANLRLLNLYQWGVLHRFQPHRDLGSHPMHYVLDTAGAAVLAHEDGIDPNDLSYNRDREIGRAYSLQLAHTVGCNTLFTTLIRRARQPGRHRRSSPPGGPQARCGRHWGDIVTPDGYGRWHEAGRTTSNGSSNSTSAPNNSPASPPNSTATNDSPPHRHHHPHPVLAPQPAREANARRALAGTLRGLDRPDQVPVATTNPTATPHPLDMTATALATRRRPPSGRVPLSGLTRVALAPPATNSTEPPL